MPLSRAVSASHPLGHTCQRDPSSHFYSVLRFWDVIFSSEDYHSCARRALAKNGHVILIPGTVTVALKLEVILATSTETNTESAVQVNTVSTAGYGLAPAHFRHVFAADGVNVRVERTEKKELHPLILPSCHDSTWVLSPSTPLMTRI